jgi:hypothetical protein
MRLWDRDLDGAEKNAPQVVDIRTSERIYYIGVYPMAANGLWQAGGIGWSTPDVREVMLRAVGVAGWSLTQSARRMIPASAFPERGLMTCYRFWKAIKRADAASRCTIKTYVQLGVARRPDATIIARRTSGSSMGLV